MKIGVYAGSFNPWHDGHRDVLAKALKVFDKVIIAVGTNPEKTTSAAGPAASLSIEYANNPQVDVQIFNGLLVHFVKQVNATALIRGLRNGTTDFEYEKVQQYFNEDLGITVPTVCFISDRKLVHISSSAIRAMEKLK